eukprot:GHRR01018671.1.p2 GENE.GHRR01018671.1~~GHRR01018671.1.p2  ORF type:complete len:138 (+),score=29.28 GHRR01018671.1:1224-1637(+)
MASTDNHAVHAYSMCGLLGLTCNGFAPSVFAASSCAKSICSSVGINSRTINGSVTNMVARAMPARQSSTGKQSYSNEQPTVYHHADKQSMDQVNIHLNMPCQAGPASNCPYGPCATMVKNPSGIHATTAAASHDTCI